MMALQVEQLSHRFGGLLALNDVNLVVAPGERLAIIGPNGAGKTTLFNIVTGIFRPMAGRIRLFGQDVTRLPPHRRAQLGLARTFQITTLFPRLTVLDSVLLAVQGLDPVRFALHRPRETYRHLLARAEALLVDWGLADRCQQMTGRLSYGEQRQVELILALAGAPKVLLLDEPTAGLSPAETASVTEMIRRFSRDTTILLIEHDMDVALDLVDRVAVLFQGRVLAEGSKDKIRSDPEVAAIYLGTDDDA
ncbi:MAG: ABC transporter ATP-binding protein [Candidatus Rokuibacteriota bacterium]|nr:MAG: ABC transporter ATP-binding protein [Candidatus Rokubacteria bacterium]